MRASLVLGLCLLLAGAPAAVGLSLTTATLNSLYKDSFESLLTCVGRKAECGPIAELQAQFKLDARRLTTMTNHMLEEMKSGLSRDSDSSLLMLPTHLTSVPTGSEKGDYLALDLGGTNFRVLKVSLEGEGKFKVDQGKFKVEDVLMKGHGKDLFTFIAKKVKEMVPQAAKSTTAMPLGFTFSFPVEQSALNIGKLVKWTKGFTCAGVEGEDVVAMLQKALNDQKLNIKVVAMVNDTPGTMLAAAYSNPDVCAGLILGTGTNCCYMEKVDQAPKLQSGTTTTALPSVATWRLPPYAGKSASHIINMEWGNFGSGDKQHMLPVSAYDVIVDRKSLNPGKHMYEKMISGMFLGEICRLVVTDMIAKEALFVGKAPKLFLTPGSFTTETMAFIETASVGDVQDKLVNMGLEGASTEDCRVLKLICSIVSTRAARLSAAGVAAIAKRLDKARSCHIAVDGTVFEKYPGFKDRMIVALKELLGRNMGVKFTQTSDGSGVGAAIAACTAVTGS
mmetsp:Transcript_46585/g.113445  ORF Transcript_46585/g.113445 Transcript_46585/m.113445 type:complete len:507 (-) Transcript_46585:10-1530(-)